MIVDTGKADASALAIEELMNGTPTFWKPRGTVRRILMGGFFGLLRHTNQLMRVEKMITTAFRVMLP